MICRNQLRVCCAVLLLQITISLHAQIKCKIEHYSTEDGLSHDGVMSMTKDREGFMWFGTWDGINRFDGHNFVTYKTRPGDSSNLKSNRIDSIVEDRSGNLWLKAYDNQIYRFNKKTEKFLAISEVLAKAKIRNIVFNRIVPAGDDVIWLTTAERGLFCVKNAGSSFSQIVRYAENSAPDFKLPSNKVNFLYEDKKHNIWAGTENGLCRLTKDKSGNYRNTVLPPDFAAGIGYSCAGEDESKIWFGTNEGYLIYYDKSSHRFFKERVADTKLNAICVSKKSSVLYFSTSKRQVVTVNTSNLQINTLSMPGTDPFYSIYEDRSGLLWIEPGTHGIVKYDPAAKTFKYFFQENDATFYNPAKDYNVFEDTSNKVWVSMKGGGFGYYNPQDDVIEYFFNKPGSADHQFSNIVACSYLDPDGILWLSTKERGINKIIFQRNDFNHKLLVEHTLDKSDNEIRGIYNDRKGKLWLASKSGQLYVYSNEKRITDLFVNEPGGGIGFIYTIIQDKNRAIWLGTKGNGLFRAEPVNKEETKYRLSHYRADKNDVWSLSSDLIYSLLEDEKGRIWVGTYENGLNLMEFKDHKVRFRNINNAFKNYPKGPWRKIRHLQQDAEGRLWIATTNGLILLDPDKGNADNYRFLTYRKIPGDSTSLGNNDLQFIYRDARNRMWIATSGGGLNEVAGQSAKGLKFKVFTKEDGLPSDYILSIVEDNYGNLWLATENGISKFNPDKVRFRNYDSYDGLPKTGFSEGSGLKLSNGNLLFGCIEGYITFNPAAITDHEIKASMAFTNFQINNKDVVPGKNGSALKFNIDHTRQIELKYNENIISIDFTVLDYRSSNKQVYAYRLKGFDKEWHDVKNQRKATYTNLPPGNYLFEVKSLNEDLYKNLPIKTLSIEILPPPWRTVWAYIGYIILFAALIEITRRIAFTMIRLRNRIAVEQRLSELKLRFFTNISHELRTPLTLIVNPIEEIYQQEHLSAKGYEYINVVRRNANRMVRFINQLLDFRKVQSGKMNLKIAETEMVSFVKEISRYFLEVAREKQIELEITANVTQLFAWIDKEKIDIVIYNLLSNAFKFSPKGKAVKIDIYAGSGDDFFTVRVIDQGVGVAPDKLTDIFELYYEIDTKPGNNLEGTGIGLALSREIVQFHHGKIEAQGNAAGGLTVALELKLGKEHFKNGEHIVLNAAGDLTATAEIYKEEIILNNDGLMINGHRNMPLVLIVDDNNELRKFLADQLKEVYRVAEAKDGKEGLDCAIELMPDLILSDVMMPGLNGIELLDQLKHNVATSHIPVVLLTAKSSVENQIEGLKYGADYYITKPFRTDFLLASIDNLIKQRRGVFESMLTHKKTIELGPGEIFITSKDEVFLKEVINIVEDRMTDPEFNIDTVAESIGMGRTTFYKKFKSLTNLAPVEFVREMRLKRSKQLLDAGEDTISEIAYAVGFNSAKYFSTCFREAYHLSPTEYLKSRSIKTE